MSGISGTNPQVDLRALLGDFTEIKQEARQSVENALVMLGTVIAGNSLNRENLQELPPPSFSMLGGIAELSLRIGLIQDALDQLMQEVSKVGIGQRLNQADRANQEQIARIDEQVAEAKEAAAKSKEAEEKGNLFQMIGDWVNVAITAISLAITVVGAVLGGIVTGGAATVALAVAIVALSITLAAQITLAIDSTVAHKNGGEGFLGDARGALETTAMVAGIVAAVASVATGLIAIARGFSAATAAAAKELGEEATQAAVKAATREGVKQALKESGKEALHLGGKEVLMEAAPKAAYTAFREVAAETLKTLATQAKIVTITQLANAGINAAGTVEKNKILKEAEEHLQAAKDAEAEAKAFEAVVKMLQKVISQMQEELESMIDAALQSLDAVFGIIDDTQTSQKKIMQSSGA
jgi:hypothetical protein